MKNIFALLFLSVCLASIPSQSFANSLNDTITDKQCVQLSQIATHALFQSYYNVPEKETQKMADKFQHTKMKQEVLHAIRLAYQKGPITDPKEVVDLSKQYKKEVYLTCHDLWQITPKKK